MILFALLVAHRVNSNCYKAQRRMISFRMKIDKRL